MGTRRVQAGLWVAVGALVALATGCASEEAPAKTPDPPQKSQGPPPATVQVEQARGGALSDELSFLGQIRPKHAATIAAGASDTVAGVAVREGDAVEAGAELVVLDAAVVEARLAAAKATVARFDAELDQAKRELARADKLRPPVVTVAEQERYAAQVASLRAQLRGARAGVRQIEAELTRHRIVAPFAGVVARRHVDPGAWVSPGTPLVDLVSVDDVEVQVDVAPTLRRHVAVDQAATLSPGTGAPVAATVRGVVPTLDDQTRTMRVRLEPDAPDPRLMPNTPVEVTFAVEIDDEGVKVSRDALVQGAVNVRIIKVVEDKATPVTVEVLATAGAEALVRGEGLAVGDTVVNRGNDRLRPGQAVKVAE